MGLMDFSDFLSATNDKKNPIDVTTVMPQHPTGFMYLDYGCGSYMNVYDENEQPLYTYHNIGFTSGSVNSLLSKSQGGKTTLAIEMANAIIEGKQGESFEAEETEVVEETIEEPASMEEVVANSEEE